MKILFTLLAGMLFFLLPVSSQEINTGSKETYALVIGISNYHFIKPLNYADKDADLFADFLRSAAGGRIKEENLVLLKNDSANAGNFWSGLARLNNKKLNKGDRVYIYFAGHGDAIKGLNEYYLLLSDCQPANDGNNYLLSIGAIDMYRLKNRIGLLTGKGAEVVLILDACRTNELAGGYATQVFSSGIVQANVGEISMLATGPGQVSIEDMSFAGGHGLFTFQLIDGLSGLADEEGDKDNSISLKELNQWVTRNVQLKSGQFRVRQVPTFCCEINNNSRIGIVDKNFSMAWKQVKQPDNTATAHLARKAERNNDLSTDTGLLALYNKFNGARKDNMIWGYGSADMYYEQMESRFPGEQITEDARYALAADFINFGQQKINLYLEGKDLLSIQSLLEKKDTTVSPGFLSDEYERQEKAVAEKWTIAANMLLKAGRLLSSKNDSSIFYQLKPKAGFMLARGYLGREKENKLNYEEALQYAREAYNADSSAAYTAECLALVHTYRYSINYRMPMLVDPEGNEYEFGSAPKGAAASMKFFQQAIRLAPHWVSPYRSIAVKVFGEMNPDSAVTYLHKALALNRTDATTYIMLGDLYRHWKQDSASYYFKKALHLSGKRAYPMIYRKMARIFLSGKVNPDSVLYYSGLALAADSALTGNPLKKAELYRGIYFDIANAYSLQKKEELAIEYYHKVTALFPDNFWANHRIIDYYNKRGLPDSAFYFSRRYLTASPENAFALLEIARFFDNKKGFADSAIHYYERNLAVTREKDAARERLGYLLMAKDKNDPRPLDYFTQTMNEFPSAWRSYYNIACYYAHKGEVEKSVVWLEMAAKKGLKNKSFILDEPHFTSLQNLESFRIFLEKYFAN